MGLVVTKDKIAEDDYGLSGERYRALGPQQSRFGTVPIGEVAIVIAGQSPPGRSYNDTGQGVPFYQGKTEFGELFIGEPKTWTTDPRRFADVGDILISVRAPVGPVNLAPQKLCIGRGLAAIRPSQDQIDKMYAFYILRSMESQITGSSGAALPLSTREKLRRSKSPSHRWRCRRRSWRRSRATRRSSTGHEPWSKTTAHRSRWTRSGQG